MKINYTFFDRRAGHDAGEGVPEEELFEVCVHAKKSPSGSAIENQCESRANQSAKKSTPGEFPSGLSPMRSVATW